MTTFREVPGPQATRFSSITHVDETGSTNVDLLREVSSGRPEGAVLVTDHQTAGRGRQARVWHDEPGDSMLMSVLLRPPPEMAPLIPFVAGMAIVDAVAALSASLAPERLDFAAGLKWPNDVLVPRLDERKLAGILTEATTAVGPDAPTPLAVVAGMGLNLRWSKPPPAEIAARAATLAEVLGAQVSEAAGVSEVAIDRWAVAEQVLIGIEHWLTVGLDHGPEAIVEHYRSRCLTLGRNVRFQTPTELIEGRAVAIAADGGLVVDGPAGPVTVIAGDAHHV